MERDNFREKYVNTHIDVLDKLLGKSTVAEGHGVIEEGSIVIIRGEPGCGKTTLGLQILSEYLGAHPGAWAGYFSLEKPPDLVLNKMEADFGMFRSNRKKVMPISAHNVHDLIDYIAMPHMGISDAVSANSLLDKCLAIISHVAGKDDFNKAAVASFVELVHYWQNRRRNRLRSAVHRRFSTKMAKLARHRLMSTETNLIFIDSINALTRLIRVSLPGIDERVLLSVFLDSMKKTFGRVVVLASSEAARGTPFGSDAMSESYLCDVQLLLRSEPVTVAPHYMGEDANPVGYSIAKIREILDEGKKQVESRPFCRIVKSRDCAHQCRRVSFEFASGEGLRFHESYPGDGEFRMFTENAAQRNWWNEFITRDLPSRYPALRYEIFERASLQVVYDSRRMVNKAPLKTDLYISAFDSYWIRWYCDRKIADEIDSLMADIFSENSLNEGNKAEATNCAMHIARDKDETLNWFYRGSSIRSQSYERLKSIVGPSHARQIERRIKNALAEGKSSYVQPISLEELKRYGDRDSEFIEPIESGFGLIRKPRTGDGKTLLSVPYDANVSFFVFRKDLLRAVSRALKGRGTITPVLYERLAEYLNLQGNGEGEAKEKLGKKILEIERECDEKLRDAFEPRESEKQGDLTARNLLQRFNARSHAPSSDIDGISARFKQASEVAVEKELLDEAAGRILSGDPPETIEEVVVFCEMTGSKISVDTSTFDTLLCFFWELVWNCGGEFIVHGDYSIDKGADNLGPTFAALYWFFRFFRAGIIQQMVPTDAQRPSSTDPNWAFARHWYSTFVDIVTRTKKVSDYEEEFVWRPGSEWQFGSRSEFGLAPMPVSLRHMNRAVQGCPKEEREQRKADCHHSSMGEWHWAVLQGSENLALGVELINSLMTSQRIWERASKSAAVPTVKGFYEDYGNMKCFDKALRTDIGLPEETFEGLLKRYLKNAKTRNAIYDYRHCARLIHGLLTGISSVPPRGSQGTDDTIVFRTHLCSYIHCLETIESFYKQLN